MLVVGVKSWKGAVFSLTGYEAFVSSVLSMSQTKLVLFLPYEQYYRSSVEVILPVQRFRTESRHHPLILRIPEESNYQKKDPSFKMSSFAASPTLLWAAQRFVGVVWQYFFLGMTQNLHLKPPKAT
jgi:hypothetical protein